MISDEIITFISKLIYASRIIAQKTSESLTDEDLLEEDLYNKTNLDELSKILANCEDAFNLIDLNKTQEMVKVLLINTHMERLKYDLLVESYNNKIKLLNDRNLVTRIKLLFQKNKYL